VKRAFARAPRHLAPQPPSMSASDAREPAYVSEFMSDDARASFVSSLRALARCRRDVH